MATLNFNVAEEDEEERKRRLKRLEAMRAADTAFTPEQEEANHTLYKGYEELSLTLSRLFKADDLDSRLANFQCRHAVLPASPEAPEVCVTVNFDDTTDITVTENQVTTQQPCDAAEEAFKTVSLAKAISHGRPVEITDCSSDYELFLVYLAAEDMGLEINKNNGSEIRGKINRNSKDYKDAKAEWQAFKALDMATENSQSREAARKLKEAKMAVEKNFGASAAADEPVPSAEETRVKFNKPIGMIAGDFVKHDNAAAEAIKAEFFALLQAEDRLDEGDLPKNRHSEIEAFKLNADKRTELIAKAGITEEEMDAAKAEVAKADFSGEGMPLYGDILVSNGFVDRDVKNTLLAAQAAIRTLDIVDRVASGNAQTPEREFDFSKFGAFDDGDIDLTNAQLAHRAAYAKEVAVASGADSFPKVEGFKASALDSLEKAAAKLDALGQPKASQALSQVLATYKEPAQEVTAPKPGAAPGATATG